MAAIVLNEEQAVANSRLTALRLVELALRSMETWRRNVGDYDSAMVLLAVVAITAGRLLRSDLDPELRNMGNAVPGDRLGRCSYSSIAAATGLNRETTRRKVAQLVERGYLVRTEDGSIRFPDGYLQRQGPADIVRSQLESFIRTANELVRDGVIEIVE
jgi:DNA-binding transcriptional regulator YhcF (GntR family)